MWEPSLIFLCCVFVVSRAQTACPDADTKLQLWTDPKTWQSNGLTVSIYLNHACISLIYSTGEHESGVMGEGQCYLPPQTFVEFFFKEKTEFIIWEQKEKEKK